MKHKKEYFNTKIIPSIASKIVSPKLDIFMKKHYNMMLQSMLQSYIVVVFVSLKDDCITTIHHMFL